MYSMTARAELGATVEQLPFTASLKILNHRFLNLCLHLPAPFQSLDIQIRKFLQGSFKRGSVEFAIVTASAPARSAIDPRQLQRVLELEQQLLSKTQHLQRNPLTTYQLVQLLTVEQQPTPTLNWQQLQPFLKTLTAQVRQQQYQEGQLLRQDLQQTMNAITGWLAQISAYDTIEARQQRATELLRAYALQNSNEDLCKQLVGGWIRTDIHEECVRMSAHLQHGQELFNQPGPVAKEFDFVAQEMQREVNTILAKGQHQQLKKAALKIKLTVEQLREQLSNLE